MTTGKTILILGAGIGGIVLAKALRKKLSREHRIIVFERASEHRFAPSFLWVMIGARTPKQISRPISRLGRHGFEVVQGDIEQIFPAERRVRVAGRDYRGDYLVVATGAELAPELVPGLAEAGHNLYTAEGAHAISALRNTLTRGRIAVLVCSLPFKCPAAPYEAAMLLEADARQRGVRSEVSIALYTPEPGPLPVAGPQVSGQVRQMIENKDICYFPQHAVQEVDPIRRVIRFANGHEAEFDLLVYIPPHRAAAVVKTAGLVAEGGWIPVDRMTLETQFPGVYAIGDVTGIMLSIGKPLPKAGVFADGQAEVVANNIALAILGQGAPAQFAGEGACFLEVGDGRAGMGAGNFYTEPAPTVKMSMPSWFFHIGKIIYEKSWLYRL